jgi:TonB family protein
VPGKLVPPVTVKQVTPKYPKALRKSKGTAIVLIKGIVSANGDFIDYEATQNNEDDAARSALAVMSRYKFQPATLDGKPVAIYIAMSIHFEMAP